MKKNIQGSALIILLIMITGLLIYTGIVWRTTAYMVDISLQRERYECQHGAAYALMQWSLALCKHNFDSIQHACAGSLVIPLKKWPPKESSPYHAQIECANRSENVLTIVVKLFEEQSSDHVRSLSCCLERNEQNFYKIFDWKIE